MTGVNDVVLILESKTIPEEEEEESVDEEEDKAFL